MSPQNRYQAISVVPEGDGFVLGRPGLADFVAVPRIGGLVIQWLQAGDSVETCTARAGEVTGQDVDVARFLTSLEAADVLTATDEPPAAAPFGQRAGRILYGPAGLTVHGLIVVVGLVLFLTDPSLRPNYRDAVPFQSPIANILVMSTAFLVLATAHEFAHKLAAARLGVHGRISFGRRLIWIVAQTDLTGLWALPRRRRIVPLAVGMLTDATVIAILLVVQTTAKASLGSLGLTVVKLVVYYEIGAIVGQLSVYVRTDFYALYLVLTRSRNLWALKGALARRLVRRTTADDEAVIADARPHEVFWARVYLPLYIPGVLFAVWYFAVFRLRATLRMLGLCLDSVTSGSLLAAVGGAVSFLVVLLPLSIAVTGALRAGYRTLVRTIRGS